MKIIFLDIDGVLNCQGSSTYFGVAPGIDEDKLLRLQRIIQATGARIVLTSSWKEDWQEKNAAGQYIDNVLASVGLSVFDKTEDRVLNRGFGIQSWINSHNVQSYVILDDECFDYEEYPELEKRWIQTVFGNEKGGLQEEHVEKAISILNKDIEAIIRQVDGSMAIEGNPCIKEKT